MKFGPLTLRQLFDKNSSTFSYLLVDEPSQHALLIDPVLDQVERDLKLIKELGVILKYTAETHVHADHITGAFNLKVQTACQTIVPKQDNVQNYDWQIDTSESILLGESFITALSTPGHVDAHMSYSIPGAVFTGDALLIRGCGRTDFQSGDPSILFDSITNILFKLPEETVVFPGHDYVGRCNSTIREERQHNPRLNHLDQGKFIQTMQNLNLPKPKHIDIAVPRNLNGGAE